MVELGDFPMMRRMVLGLAERAEDRRLAAKGADFGPTSQAR